MGDGCRRLIPTGAAATQFRLDESQVELQDTVRRFCAGRFALDRVAERILGMPKGR